MRKSRGPRISTALDFKNEDAQLPSEPNIREPKMSQRKARRKPADEATFYIQSLMDKPGLVERFIDDHKGRGVFATQPFKQGDFVLEYRGQLLSAEKCQTQKYSEKESTFLFDFEWQNRRWCIDASIEDGSLGRLVNDNHNSPNCTMKKIIRQDEPHLCLFAIKNIDIGTEIHYNYGDSKWPWREKAPAAANAATTVVAEPATTEPAATMHDFDTDDCIKPDTSFQVKGSQTATATVEPATTKPATSVLDFDTYDCIKPDASFQVKGSQTATATAEPATTEPATSVLDFDTYDCIKPDASFQFTSIKGFSLVDYSDSDDTDNDAQNVLSSSLQMDLKRNTIMMSKVTSFPDAIYDSSNDSVEDPSTSLSIASQRSKRGTLFSRSFAGLDEASDDSEEEYVPDSCGESSDSEASVELSMEKVPKNKIGLYGHNQSNIWRQDSCESSESTSSESHDSRSSTCNNKRATLEESSVYVIPVLKKEDGSRAYSKKHHCVYCGLLVQKMSRHLMRKHMDKVDVTKAFSMPKNSKERRLQLDYIRNKGNFEHNNEVLQNKEGKLIAFKQPKEKTEVEIFKHCLYCYGLFKKKTMWRHFRTCKLKPQEESSKKGKTRVQALCAFAEPVPSGFSESYWKFLSEMHQDEITVACKSDRCILEYGYRLFYKNEKVVTQLPYIRQKLRELGRLLLEAKKTAPVKSLKDLIKPERYVEVVAASRRLAGFNEETGKFQRPSLARKIGHNMHSLAMFIKTEGLKMSNKETVQNAEQFAELYQESWKYDIASQALTQIEQKKWNAPLLLPLTHDVQILHNHLSEKQEECLHALKEEASQSSWKDLAKVTLAQLILFNRRRAGEVSRMHLSVYLSKDTSETHEDVNLALTELEQKLCKYFVRITIVGKRGRKVPVLLSPSMKESLDALTEKREESGVLKENLYLFALPKSFHYIRGSDCLRQFVSECSGLKNPTALTSTKLRKHIATMSTVLNLKTTELDQLADFLGHNIAVHRKHYRLPEGTMQLAKISKVLLALEQGCLGDYKGKSLDEIHLDVNETIDMDGISKEEEDMPEESEDDNISSHEDGLPEVLGVTPCASTSFDQSKQKFAKKRDGLPEVLEVTPCATTSCDQSKQKFTKKRGKEKVLKRSWTPEECAAVNKHLRKYLITYQVPGKHECERCIAAEPEALRNRDWKAVKYFVKNRITTKRRKSE